MLNRLLLWSLIENIYGFENIFNDRTSAFLFHAFCTRANHRCTEFRKCVKMRM